MRRHGIRSRPSAALLALSLVGAAIAGCRGTTPGIEGDPPDAGQARDAATDAAIESDAAVGPDAEGDAGGPCPPWVLEPAAADVLWVVDTSRSWESRHERYQGAIDAVIEGTGDWDGGEHALARFPRFVSDPETRLASCEIDAYTSLDLGWGATPDAIEDEVAIVAYEGDSPLGPALEGAIALARARAAASRSTSIVLVTDASPGTDEACEPSDWDDVAAIAARGFDLGRAGGVHVHVLSVIGPATAPDHVSRLATIAAEGGGYFALVNGSRTEIARSALRAIHDLEDRASTCTRILPPGAETPEHVTVRFPDGTVRAARRVADARGCDSAAWGFYVDDPEAPSTMTLCSGWAGLAGFCEVVFTEARTRGAPTFELDGVCAPRAP